MRQPPIRLALPDAAATETLGVHLAEALPDLSRGCLVVHLRGELGAGKTTCVRGFLRRLGVQGLVRSPTYTLVEPYAVAELTCVHVDLYRLRDPSEVEDLGLRDYLAPRCVLLIEWPEKGEVAVPPPDLSMHIHYAGESRRVELQEGSDLGASTAVRLISLLGNN